MVSHIISLFFHYPKMIEDKIWNGLIDSQKKVAVLAALIFSMISVAYLIYKYHGRIDVSAKKLDQEQEDEIKPEDASGIKQELDSEIKDEPIVFYSKAAAVPVIKDYDNWKPVSANSLDLRLFCATEDKENEIISKKAKEMGKNLEAVYTQFSSISIEGFQALVEHCPHLKVLNLCCAQKTDGNALKIISGLKELEQLNLANLMYSDDHTYDLELITEEEIGEILHRCQNLKSLDLSYTKITAKTLDLLALLPKLSFVSLHNCWKLTNEDLANFTEMCPHITLNMDPNVIAEFTKLKNAVKFRYCQKIESPTGGFRVSLKSGLSADEVQFISSSVFC